MSPVQRIIKAPVDFIVTIIMWGYFLFGYVAFYIPLLIILSPFIRSRDLIFQNINHVFYRLFFSLLHTITPGLTIRIGEEVKSIRSAIVISNHRSYLDPILMISLFPKHRTIVKGIFFKVPVMRWVMKSSGYIPYGNESKDEYRDLMIDGIQSISDFVRRGGVLFIFPEGRRSRNGSLGKFQKGAFSIAVNCNTPVEMLYINNTDRLFTPGKFFFNTCIRNTITVERLGKVDPGQETMMNARHMRDQSLKLYRERIRDKKSD